MVSLGSLAPPPPASSRVLPVASFPSAPLVPPFSFASSGVLRVPPLSPDVSTGLGASASRGARSVGSHGSFFDCAGSSESCDDSFHYCDFDDFGEGGKGVACFR